MKTIKDYITESNIDVPLEEILDNTGRVLAHLPMFADPKDYANHSFVEFTFKNAAQMREFKDTTFSREFWLELYGYDSVGVEQNNWNEIKQEMSKFGNCIVNRKLIVYPFNDSYAQELVERCKMIEKLYDFKKVEYL